MTWQYAHTYDDLLAIAEQAEAYTAENPFIPTPTRPGCLANGEEIQGEDGVYLRPRTVSEIYTDLTAITGGWPRQVGKALFTHESDRIRWIENPAALFAYVGSKSLFPPQFFRRDNVHTRSEVFEHLRATVECYDGIAEHPHIPMLPGHYYTCGQPDPILSDGVAINELLDRFSPATPIDRDLILALLATLLWGGPAGARPIFLITSDDGRGSGKTKLAEIAGMLCGGCIAISHNENVETLRARLLSPEGLKRRIGLLDNIKTSRFSWAELEAMVTAESISGKAMYVGEAQRPNLITFIATINGVAASEDIAQRSVMIKLAKPTYSGAWLEDTRAFVAAKRKAITADIAAFFELLPADLAHHTRAGSWEQGVLSRLPEPAEAQRVISERQSDVNVDREEAEIVESYFADALKGLGYIVEIEQVWIPTKVAAQLMSEALGERITSVAAGRKLRQMVREGQVERIAESRHHGGKRGVYWWPSGSFESTSGAGTFASGCEQLNVRDDIEEKFKNRKSKWEGWEP